MEPCVILPLPRAVDPEAVFAPAAGVAALTRVVRSMLGTADPARIVVATTSALRADVEGCLGSDAAVIVAPEPGTRQQVLAAALRHLGIERDSSVPVLVCDHRYPLSTGVVANRVVDALRDGYGAVVPTLPVTDTIKSIDGRGFVLATVDRATLRHVQYPRGFVASVLWELISAPSAAAGDELDAVLRAGVDVGTVDGDPTAFAVELPRDANLLDAILTSRRG